MLSAHLIKYNTVKFIENSDTDNIKISYDKVAISGFPFAWNIVFHSMKITSIEKDGLNEVLLENVSIRYYLYRIKIALGNIISFLDARNPEYTKNHKILSTTEHNIDINYDIPIFQIQVDDIFKNITSLEFNVSPTKYSSEGQLKFEIAEGYLKVNKSIVQNKEIFKIKAATDAVILNNNNLNLQLLLDTNYIIPLVSEIESNNLEAEYDYRIILNKLLIKSDQSMLNLSGALNFKKEMAPIGKLKIIFKNYPSLIDELLPDNFIISKTEINNFIDTNAKYENEGDLSYFNIIFSPQGIETGRNKTTLSI
jgi:hypothetical protein